MRNVTLSRLAALALSLALLASLLVAGAVPAGAAYDPAKIDVWDFGAEQLDESVYNNLLTADEINSWYPAGTAAGTASNTLPSFESATGISFNDGGKPNTHRIRTMNEALTRFDAKSLVGESGEVYQGYLYSNSGKNPDVYLAIQLSAGDKVTVIAGSNGGESLITFEGPDGVEDQQNYTRGGGNAQTMVFYPRESGTYKLWSQTEKLVIARVYRERAKHTVVSGAVTQPAGLSGYSIAFTNTINGAVIAAQVSGEGTYSTELPAPFSYGVSLLNANGYVVEGAPTLTLDGQAAGQTFDLTVAAVPLVTVSGKLTGIAADALSKLQLTFTADTVYVPQVTVTGDSYTAVLAQGDAYTLGVAGVNDYDLVSAPTVSYDADATADIAFSPKPTYQVTIAPTGVDAAALASAAFTFTNLDEAGEAGDERLVPYNSENIYPYVYTFTGPDAIALRDGTYDLRVTGLSGYEQALTSNVVVSGAPVTKTVGFKAIAAPQPIPYRETVTVGPQGCDYTTVSDAVAAVRAMTRSADQRVTISVQPGNYEEMLVVDVPNVTLKNASATPSLELMNKGVDVTPNAVRITHYYGCGYNYYSMNDQCKYDPELLAVNKENGYESFVNPGDGVDNDSYWNSTVLIKASGFRAEGIIFENSFNQYISPKSLTDVIVPNSECKEDKAAPRAEMKTAGDTTVQNYVYKERAGALSITDNCTQVYFENCKFISRQDTLYGGDGVFAAFYDCDILGSTDYIYGPMTAVFAKCDLIFNTGEHEFDLGYITAPRHTSTRGFLMYNCTVSYTTPGVDTASALVSKPGYFGRPWQAQTGEAVFYDTVVEPSYDDQSLILPAGWFDSLSGQSPLVGEYGTVEAVPGLDNLDQRVTWAQQFTTPALTDGTPITVASFLGDWDAFAGKNMDISTHTFAEAKAGTHAVTVDGKTVSLPTLTLDGTEYVWIRDAATALAGTSAQFNVTWDNGVALVPGQAYVPSGPADTSALTGDVVYVHPTFPTTLGGQLAQLKAVVFNDAAKGGYTCYRLADLASALGLTL